MMAEVPGSMFTGSNIFVEFVLLSCSKAFGANTATIANFVYLVKTNDRVLCYSIYLMKHFNIKNRYEMVN